MSFATKYREYYENFDVFDEASYGRSFDYESDCTSFKDLNFIYLCSKPTFNSFKKIIGVADHDFVEDQQVDDTNLYTNDDILDLDAETNLNDHQDYKTLSYCLKDDIPEEDLIFMGSRCFKLVKMVFKNVKEVKRVVYRTNEGLKAELYPPHIKVLILDNENLSSLKILQLERNVVNITISKYMNGEDLQHLITKIAMNKGYKDIKESKVLLPESNDLGPAEARNIVSGKTTAADLSNDNLCQFDIYEGKLVLFYFKDRYSKWKLNFNIENKGSIAVGRADNGIKSGGYWKSKMEEEELLDADNNGVVGLGNVGNTCYMNSALQCMLHTDALRQFMMMDGLSREINKNNPLGTRGELLNAFSELYKTYWRTKSNRFSPSKFKHLVGKHFATFEGFAQHDSQEFLSQMLDAIHEDVNRILNKPYTETIEGKLEDKDYEVARKSWINFLRRNYSMLIENFYGQFKSTVCCPTCKNASVTFDPYQIVSLGIPIIAKQDFSFFFTNADQTEKAIKYGFSAKSLHNFSDIKLQKIIAAYAEKLRIPAARLQFALLGFSKQGQVCRGNLTLSTFYELSHSFTTKPKIFLFELNDVDFESKNDPESLEIYLRTNYEFYDRADLSRNSYEYNQLQKEFPEDPIFTKVIYLTKKHTVRDLYIAVLRKFYHCTNLYEQGKKEHGFFDKLWNLLEIKLKDKAFFYLKVDETKLTMNMLDKPLRDFIVSKNNESVVSVFLRGPKNTATKIDLTKILSCTQDRDDDLEFESSDLMSYKGEYSLEYLLNLFSQPEVLSKENAWYCSKCAEHVQATKTIQIYKAPRFLIIHLKKLKFQAKKIPLITFPIDKLDMSSVVLNKEPTQAYYVTQDEFISPNDRAYYQNASINPIIKDHTPSISLQYKLYGVVNHYGSQHFGHYTAYSQLESGDWYEFDDASTTAIQKNQIVSEGAYILFYEKISN